jgi:hypothetical protein
MYYKKQVSYKDILKVLDASKVCSSVQNFTDVYLRLPGIPSNGQLTEGECIRVRICEGRFALLIREVCVPSAFPFYFCFIDTSQWYITTSSFQPIQPIREGNFIIQPKVDFDISASTVAGLLKLGYVVCRMTFSFTVHISVRILYQQFMRYLMRCVI